MQGYKELSKELRATRENPVITPITWQPERGEHDSIEPRSFLTALIGLYNDSVSEVEQTTAQLLKNPSARIQRQLERQIKASNRLLNALNFVVQTFYQPPTDAYGKSRGLGMGGVATAVGALVLPAAAVSCENPKPAIVVEPGSTSDLESFPLPTQEPTIAAVAAPLTPPTGVPPVTPEAGTVNPVQEPVVETETPSVEEWLENYATEHATPTPEGSATPDIKTDTQHITPELSVTRVTENGAITVVVIATPFPDSPETMNQDLELYTLESAVEYAELHNISRPTRLVVEGPSVVEGSVQTDAVFIYAADANGTIVLEVIKTPTASVWSPAHPVAPENPAESGQGVNNPEALQIPTHEPSLQEFAEQSFTVNPENGDVTIKDVNGNEVDNIIFLNRAGLDMTMTYQPWSTEAVAAFQEFEDKFRAIPYENGRKNSLGQPLMYSWNPSTEKYEEVALPLPELDESGKIIPSSTPEWIFATLPMKDTLSYLNGKDLPFPFMLRGESSGGPWYRGAMYIPDESGETAGKVYFYTTATPGYEYYRVLMLTFGGATITARNPIQIKNFLGSTYNSLGQLGLDSLQVNGLTLDTLGAGPDFELQTGSISLTTTEEEKLTGTQLESFSQFKLSSGEILLHSQSDEQNGIREFHFVLLSQAEAGLRTVQTQVKVTGVLQLDATTGGFSINDSETGDPLVIVSQDHFSLLAE